MRYRESGSRIAHQDLVQLRNRLPYTLVRELFGAQPLYATLADITER